MQNNSFPKTAVTSPMPLFIGPLEEDDDGGKDK
jgi:hypothetical protein